MDESEATVIVDGSNVCCDRRFDDTGDLARWDRLVAVLDGYRQQIDENARPLVIADESLERKLSRNDRQLLRDACDEGWARVSGNDADAEVLRIAAANGASVISRDRFVDYRSHHTWIDDNTDRFFDWIRTPSGVRLRPRGMGTHTGFSVSRAAERTLLKERGMLKRRDGREQLRTTLLDHKYVCENPRCIAAKLTPDDIGIPRRSRDGEPLCPGCGAEVVAAEPRPVGVQMKMWAPGGDEQRFAVTAEGPVVLGRGRTSPDGVDPSLLLPEDDRRRISREHLELQFDGGAIRMIDLDSTHGTVVRRWDGATGSQGEATALAANVATGLAPRDELILAGLVTVTMSGQRFGVR